MSEQCVQKFDIGMGLLVLCSVCLHVCSHTLGTQQKLMMEWGDIAVCCSFFLSCVSLKL